MADQPTSIFIGSGPGGVHPQALQLFLNSGNGFVEGVGPQTPYVRRGLAASDLDGDGDFDLVLSQNGGPAVLLRNDASAPLRDLSGQRVDGPLTSEEALSPRWLRVRLRGPGANTWGYGAEVTARIAATTAADAAASPAARSSSRRLDPSGS